MNVSVIIPAYNAAETLAETLESLCAQTFGEWETIVVDDGSSDETAAIAGRFVAREPRIRVISQPHWGGSVARNTGLRLARFEWLLFLDADDWILPRHLERLTAALQADPALDAVYCGWKRVTSDGALIYEDYGPEEDDLFEVFARRTPFPPLAGLVRRTRVEAVGGFDPSFRTCQDWDFWQRIARAGARFSRVREVLGCYRLQPGSVSTKMPIQFLVDGLRVINQGHSLDSRVPNPLPAYAKGRARDDLSGVKLNWVCWPAGLALGRGEDARPLLHTVHEEQYPMLDPYYVAYCIFWAAPVGVYQAPAVWVELWPKVEQQVDQFLHALEANAQAPGLARRTRPILERMIVEHLPAPRPLTVGATHAVRVEVTQPLPEICAPASVERLFITVEMEGARLGHIELPACAGRVAREALADAIATQFAWLILGRFFEHTVYPTLRVERGPAGLSVYRGDVCLADNLPEAENTFWSQVHQLIGWPVLLQEIWARPHWPNARFYEPHAAGETASAPTAQVKNGRLVVEASADLPNLKAPGPEVEAVLNVGGAALPPVTVLVKDNFMSEQELRAALTTASGYELCRVCVREALLGQPLNGSASLRERLAYAARQRPTQTLDHRG